MRDEMDRRVFLKLGMTAGAGLALASAFPKFSMADLRQISLSDCMELTPEEIAGKSKMVTDSWDYLIRAAAGIKDAGIRTQVQGILKNPAPTFTAELMDGQNRLAVYNELKSMGFIPENMAFKSFLPPVKDPQKSPHPFLAGPGSGYSSHHSYPGGLITHTAANVRLSLSLYEHYITVYDFALDRDVILASQILHDLHKPWVFQWSARTGESRTEMKLAGTGEHHIYGVAESLVRGLPAGVCTAQACAHQHPGWEKDEAKPVKWLKAAAVLTGKDPVKAGLLAPGEQTLPQPRGMENFVTHLGDHDWVLSVPAAKWLIPVMAEIAGENYGMSGADLSGRKFNQFRNYVFAQASIMNLYHLYTARGKDGLARTVTAMVTPA
ncbi:MAG: hypothetical protein MI747_08085 [Desulfobacterales bacterium]|nr:hypothetical protein [Desulfobacterales bacterium]